MSEPDGYHEVKHLAMGLQANQNTWVPVLDGSLRSKAEEVVLHVTGAITDALERICDKDADRSLAGGSAGIAILASYVRRWQPAQVSRSVLDLLLGHATTLTEIEVDAGSLYFGPLGVGWVLEHLSDEMGAPVRHDFCMTLDHAIVTALSSVDKWEYRYDLFDGLVGVGTYLLEGSSGRVVDQALALVVEALESAAVRPNSGRVTWRAAPHHFPLKTTLGPRPHYNLGVPHGIPGVIVFLARAGVRLGRQHPIVQSAVDWLLEQRTSSTYPCFGTAVGIPRPTWLQPAWCYGDLGIAAALAAAGSAMGIASIVDAARFLGEGVAKDLMEGSQETGLCHGSAGNGHLFARLYQLTGDEIFRSASVVWYARALARWDPFSRSGFAGFTSGLIKQPEGSIGFLRGSAGTALCLLGAITDIAPAWDRVILASA